MKMTSHGNSYITFIPNNWFDSNYKQRNLITINNSQVPSTQTDFPFLLNETSNSDFTVMQSNGDDVRFTSLDGETVFDVEIEEADNSPGDLIAWCKIPSIDDGTEFYVYYNNPNASSAGTSTGIWSNYSAVYHMNQTTDGGGTTIDSTTNSNDGTPAFSPTLQVTGQIDGNITFNGINQRINIPDNDSLEILTGAFSVSAWIKPTNGGAAEVLVAKQRRSGIFDGWIFQLNASNEIQVDLEDTTGNTILRTSDAATPTDAFEYVVFTYDGNDQPSGIIFYRDGTLQSSVGSGSNLGNVETNGIDASIGGANDGALDFTGDIDEVRISKNVKSANFIETEFNNQSTPSSFYTIASAEIIS